MSDNVSVIDAIKLVAKATREDAGKVSDMVKGALRPEQIDDMQLMLSRAREGSLAATTSAAAAASQRDTSIQRRAWKGANKATAKFQGVGPEHLRQCKAQPARIAVACAASNRRATKVAT